VNSNGKRTNCETIVSYHEAALAALVLWLGGILFTSFEQIFVFLDLRDLIVKNLLNEELRSHFNANVVLGARLEPALTQTSSTNYHEKQCTGETAGAEHHVRYLEAVFFAKLFHLRRALRKTVFYQINLHMQVSPLGRLGQGIGFV